MIELTENCNKIRNRRDLSETENARPIVRRAFYECPSVIIPFRCYSASTTNHVLDTTENCLESLETNAHSIVRSWTHHSALRFGVFRTVCLNLPAQPDEGSPRSVGRRDFSKLLLPGRSNTHTRASGIWTTYYSIYYYLSMRRQQQKARSEGGGSESGGRAKERAKLPLAHSLSAWSFCT